MARIFTAAFLAILAISHSALGTTCPASNLEARQEVAFCALDSDLHSAHGGATNYTQVCAQIASRVSSSSLVHYPGSQEFQPLAQHWVSSSDQQSACVVEPASPADVGIILQIVGHNRTPFAVQSGGHGTNPGFSSTKGVHISLNAFRSVDYDAASQTASFGTGQIWDDVYEVLEPHGVSVLGSRVNGVGVGGFTLGGGYAWRTNQHGLTIDTVTAFELVTPNGDVVTVTEKSDKQLFFGLKGAGNNFGIVTKITLKTYPQDLVWGGILTFADPSTIPQVIAATARFSAEVTDPKASILSAFGHYQGMPLLTIQIYYDAPEPPAGIFDDFLNITAVKSNIGTQSLLSLVKSPELGSFQGFQGYFQGLAVPNYSHKFIELCSNISISYGQELANHSLVYMTLVVEPFLPSILSHNDSPTAYPFSRSKAYSPFNIFMLWTDPTQDKYIKAAVDKITATLYAALAAEGHKEAAHAPSYSNYAIWDTPSSQIYGSNLPALKALKGRVDPSNVMGLAGGFKL